MPSYAMPYASRPNRSYRHQCHTRTHAHTRAHVHAYTRPHAPAHAHPRASRPCVTRTRTHAHAHARTHMHARARAPLRSRLSARRACTGEQRLREVGLPTSRMLPKFDFGYFPHDLLGCYLGHQRSDSRLPTAVAPAGLPYPDCTGPGHHPVRARR